MKCKGVKDSKKQVRLWELMVLINLLLFAAFALQLLLLAAVAQCCLQAATMNMFLKNSKNREILKKPFEKLYSADYVVHFAQELEIFAVQHQPRTSHVDTMG